MKNKTLFYIWAALFAVCAALGFVREEAGGLGWLLTVLSLAFFAPPGVLLWRARKEKDDRVRLIIRNLSGLSLGLTLLLLVGNFLSVLGSSALGTFLHSVLTIVSAPMICSGYWALSIFLWAFLFVAAVKK